MEVDPDCPERKELLKYWRRAADAFSEAVRGLTAMIGVDVEAEEYYALRGTAEAARLDMQNARVMLDLHQKSTAADSHPQVRLSAPARIAIVGKPPG